MSLPATPKPMENRLLNLLPKNEYKSLVRSAKAVSLAHGDQVYREDSRGGLSHVYFPTSGMISLTVLMEDGKEVEAATIGNEGMVGLSVAHDLAFSPTKAISQISGEGLRIPVSDFLQAMKRGGTL
jgi:CRP-like cAMP-binding protein